jgi:hypothetical protein
MPWWSRQRPRRIDYNWGRMKRSAAEEPPHDHPNYNWDRMKKSDQFNWDRMKKSEPFGWDRMKKSGRFGWDRMKKSEPFGWDRMKKSDQFGCDRMKKSMDDYTNWQRMMRAAPGSNSQFNCDRIKKSSLYSWDRMKKANYLFNMDDGGGAIPSAEADEQQRKKSMLDLGYQMCTGAVCPTWQDLFHYG